MEDRGILPSVGLLAPLSGVGGARRGQQDVLAPWMTGPTLSWD